MFDLEERTNIPTTSAGAAPPSRALGTRSTRIRGSEPTARVTLTPVGEVGEEGAYDHDECYACTAKAGTFLCC